MGERGSPRQIRSWADQGKFSQTAYRFASAWNWGIVLGSAALVGGAVLGLLPWSYYLSTAIQIGLPLIGVAIVLARPRLYSLYRGLTGGRFDDRVRDRSTYCLAGVFVPTLYTLSIDYAYVVLPERTTALWMAGVAGTALCLASALPDAPVWRGANRFQLAFVYGAWLFWAYGAVLQLNCVLDRSPVTVHQAVVARKEHVRGHGNRLWIEPWGAETRIVDVRVPNEVFRASEVRAAACIVLHSGALDIPWYTAQACPWQGGPVLVGLGSL